MPIEQPSSLAIGPFVLDTRERVLRRNGQIIPLTPKAFQTLAVFADHAGSILTKEELMEAVWPGVLVEENNLNQQIRALRRVLGDRYIETIPRVGYRFHIPSEAAGPPRRHLTRARLVMLVGVILLLAIPTASVLVRSQSAGTEQVRSIAVLPFVNDSGNPDDAYLGFAIADSLIRRLGSTDKVSTRSSSAMARYLDSSTKPVVAGRQLRVEAILTGTFRRTPGKLLASARLIRVDDGAVLWSANFERASAQLFDLPNDIYIAAARELDLQIPRNAVPWQEKMPTSPDAWEEYMKGRYLWNRRTTQDLEKSLAYYRRAIELDPAYAPAWAGLSDSLGFLGRIEEGRTAKDKALSLDPTLGTARAGRALAYLLTDYNFELAGREFDQAVRLDPSNATGHHWYAYYYTAIGDFDRALEQMRMARRLDPTSQIIQTDTGEILYFARRFDEAIRQLEQVIDLEPTFAQAHGKLVEAYQAVGRQDDAIREMGLFLELDKSNPGGRAALAQALAAAGRRAEARRIIDEVTQNAESSQAYGVAETYAALGENDLALEWLERAYQQRMAMVAFLKVEPKLDPLRGDARFDELMARVGIPTGAQR